MCEPSVYYDPTHSLRMIEHGGRPLAGLSPMVVTTVSRKPSPQECHCAYQRVSTFFGVGIQTCVFLRILWPFASDQPLNAVHITDQLQIGYELLEVRTGHGLKPIYRNGRKPVGTIDAVKAEAREVLAKAFGEDGAEKRSRLQIVRQAMNTEWEKGGLARRDMLTFLDSL